jgi:hypothetical protein
MILTVYLCSVLVSACLFYAAHKRQEPEITPGEAILPVLARAILWPIVVSCWLTGLFCLLLRPILLAGKKGGGN